MKAFFLSLAVLSFQATAAGYGPWKFGMTKSDVSNVQGYAPYSEVQATGGLETANGEWAGKRKYVSFIFDGRGLSRIQVWAYEGPNINDAGESWREAYEYLNKNFGEIEVPQIVQAASSLPANSQALSLAAKAHVDSVGKVQMAPKAMPDGQSIFSSFMKSNVQGKPYYYVFVYYSRP